MKPLLILLVSFALLHTANAQTSANLAAELQAADAANWPAINALLIAQRDEINATHTAQIAKLSAENAALLAQQTAALVEARADQQRAKAKLKLLVDGAKDALSKRTSAERLTAGNALLAKVTVSQSDDEKAALLQQQAEIAAKLKALETK